MTAKSILTLLALLFCTTQLPTRLLAQGSLTPPAGPPAPVMKTLDQVEARIPVTAETCPGSADAVHVIPVAGSYYLTGNITGQAGKACIKLHAQGITLDLNGYSVWAAAGSTNGILVRSSGGPVVIKNGFVRFFPQHAISFVDFTNDFTIQDVAIYATSGRGINATGRGTIERVTVKGAAGYGIYCEGDGQLTVRDCRVETVTGPAGTNCAGIHATKALITGCSVAGVTSSGGETAGIYADDSSVSSCTVRSITHNGSNRVAGILFADLVTDCTVSGIIGSGSTTTGLDASGLFGCGAVSRCSVETVNGTTSHEAYGVGSCRSADQCRVLSVSGTRTHAGIRANRVTDSTVDAVPGGTGIRASSVTRSTIQDCNYGITLEQYGGTTGSLGTGGLASDNFVEDCETIGIAVFCESARITNNHVNGGLEASVQGSTGIYAEQNNGVIRIEGNTVARWDRGISAPLAKTLVVRNSAGSNSTNYNIHASMPVVAVGAIGTNPNANISQ